MKLSELNKLVLNNCIESDPELESDSDWVCGPTSCERIYFNSKVNKIVFTQNDSWGDWYENISDWVRL